MMIPWHNEKSIQIWKKDEDSLVIFWLECSRQNKGLWKCSTIYTQQILFSKLKIHLKGKISRYEQHKQNISEWLYTIPKQRI